ncbi:DUF6401 family natural product biosynthesis protein [Allonocardiopsis opalescens]|uniref:Uncharacterized protein n=1 Tax=Allonocardiopsis opalescens TaxID=1144618 RepID=A0A2T0QDL6_9ACTN|nr:DUF6401 family natural product biosynthesis protein [Allonocardiopsis opalescens]PRY01982.1 hypothetical protein CLV72_101580 [Allonocardiopsis opalescens]
MRRGFSVDSHLSRLVRDVGHFGFPEMAASPGLTALVDQHAAAVRDTILRGGGRLTRVTLTHYLHGFLDGVRERGWSGDGADYDWETQRLLSICWMARELGFVR